MHISRIKFPCRFFDGIEQREAVTVFQLGLGSCGKVVSLLECDYTDAGFEISQLTKCGEEKHFFYPWATITGRIEVS